MAGRPRYFDETELIDKATEVFWQKGYKNTSAKDLMNAMNIGQGSFYLTFKGGKKELYEKSLVRAWDAYKRLFEDGYQNADQPLTFLKSFFRSVLNRSEHEANLGCFAGNTLVESTFVDAELQEISTQLLLDFENQIETVLIDAQKKGMLSQDKSPSIIAKYFINFWNGINITLRMKNIPKKQVEEMVELNLAVLD